MQTAPPAEYLDLGRKLNEQVLAPMKDAFVGKDEIIDLLGVCLVARENLFILGPPGTAKSALVQQLARRIHGRFFDYLLTRFTEPNELFGPFDIRKLREGDLVTNTEGMLPEAALVFLDELLNANSAILNSLLLVLNERIFRRGRETWDLPTLLVVGASNRLPEDDALAALFDRFLLRVRCDNVGPEALSNVLSAGWKLDIAADSLGNGGAGDAGAGNGSASEQTGESAAGNGQSGGCTVDEVRRLQSCLTAVDLTGVREVYVDLIHRLRHAGIGVSDRRAVKLQRLLAASALVCGRLAVERSDLWVMRYIWDTEEQQEVLAGLVRDVLAGVDESERRASHPRSRGEQEPDPELVARDLEHLADRLDGGELAATEVSFLRDQLGLLAARCQWVGDDMKRGFLEEQIETLWKKFEER